MKEKWDSNIYIGKNRLENKDCKKSQGRTQHNYEGNNSTTTKNYNLNIYVPNMRIPKYIK